jgi:Family of unknown function (DUF6962)
VLHEPDVALTDYVLALECALLAWLLYRAKSPHSPIKRAFVGFYVWIGLAAILGGTFHGFFTSESILGVSLWCGVMLSIGLTGFAAWRIGGLLSFSPAVTAWIVRLAAVGLVAYCLIVLLYAQTFALALVYYLPAVVFLTISFGLQLRRRRDSAALLGVAGMLLTLLAAGVQHFRMSLHPQYFNHNAFYHLLQGMALLLIFLAARKFIADPFPNRNALAAY